MMTTVEVGEKDGFVTLDFPQSVQWVTLDAETARLVGEAIAHAAYHVRYGVEPKPGKSAIVDQIRARLVTHVTHMIRSLQQQEKLPAVIAVAVVDAILQEVT